jgi:hypothetical protein
MTYQEARRIIEASTRFDVRGGHVWLREVRWLRAVELQRAEEATPAEPLTARADAALASRVRRPPPGPARGGRRAVPIT